MLVPGGVARLFHRSVAGVTVGALGPNAQLHATNFGSISLLIQRSALPQKGRDRSGCTQTGNPRSGSIAALSLGFLSMLTRSSFSHRHRGNAELDHFEARQRTGARDVQARPAQRESRHVGAQLMRRRLRSCSNGSWRLGCMLSGNSKVSVLKSGALGFQLIQRIESR
jgi:hypothetical protein